MQVTLQYAAERLAELASSAHSGEEVEISVPNAPVRLVAFSVSTVAKKPRKELLGAGEGLITLPTDEEWEAMDNELEDLMLN